MQGRFELTAALSSEARWHFARDHGASGDGIRFLLVSGKLSFDSNGGRTQVRDSHGGTLKPPASSSLWHPMRTHVFRNLLIADVVSDIGTFMQSVGAALMKSCLTISSRDRRRIMRVLSPKGNSCT